MRNPHHCFGLWSCIVIVCIASHCVAAALKQRKLSSGLWTLKGKHSTELLATLPNRHLQGTGYSRFKHSHVIEVSEEDLWDIIDSKKLLAIPIPKPLGKNAKEDDREFVECSFLLEDANVASNEFLAGLADKSVRTLHGMAVTGDEQVCSGARAAFDYNSYMGFHGMISTRDLGTVFVDPYTMNEKDLYNIYWRKDNTGLDSNDAKQISERSSHANSEVAWSCGVTREMEEASRVETSPQLIQSLHAAQRSRRLQGVGPVAIRTLRAAITCSEEYLAFFDGDINKAAVAVVTTMTRVSEVYRRDFGIEFQVVGNPNVLLTTPLKNSDNGKLDLVHTEIQRAMAGEANFDIGHFFHTLDNGLALVAGVCQSQLKGQGASGSPNPTVDAFHVDYVAHEIGHQMGASHTMIGAVCNKFDPNTSVEPGSGSTIMGYAGICQDDNLQSNTDDYFHTLSVAQIESTMATRAETCGTLSADALPRPIVAVASTTFDIPYGTPFELSVANVENAPFTYTWEQLNPATTGRKLETNLEKEGRFRSYQPRSSSARRSFPSRELLFANSNNDDLADSDGDIVSVAAIKVSKALLAEQIPFRANQVMEFAVTARATDPLTTRGTSVDIVTVTVTDKGPFEMRYPTNSGDSIAPNTTTTIRWELNGAEQLSPKVDVMLSLDNGLTFETLASNVDNSGTFEYVAPPNLCATGASQGRVMVASLPLEGAAAGASYHRFFAVSEKPVVINCGGGNTLIIAIAGGVTGLLGIVAVGIVVRNRGTSQPLLQNNRIPKPPGGSKSRFQREHYVNGPEATGPQVRKSLMQRMIPNAFENKMPYLRPGSRGLPGFSLFNNGSPPAGFEVANPLFASKDKYRPPPNPAYQGSPPSAFSSSPQAMTRAAAPGPSPLAGGSRQPQRKVYNGDRTKGPSNVPPHGRGGHHGPGRGRGGRGPPTRGGHGPPRARGPPTRGGHGPPRAHGQPTRGGHGPPRAHGQPTRGGHGVPRANGPPRARGPPTRGGHGPTRGGHAVQNRGPPRQQGGGNAGRREHPNKRHTGPPVPPRRNVSPYQKR